MGNNRSKNLVENSIRLSTDLRTLISQSCITNVNASQVISCRGCKNFSLSNSRMNIKVLTNTECLQSASSQSEIRREIESRMQQQATAITTSLNLNPGSASAENITRTMINLSTRVSNEFINSCSNNITTTQMVQLDQSEGSTVQGFEMDILAEGISKCTQDGVSSSTEFADVVQAIDQVSLAERLGLLDFGPLALIILGVVVVLGVGAAKGSEGASKVLTSRNFMVIGLAGISAYVGLSVWNDLKPPPDQEANASLTLVGQLPPSPLIRIDGVRGTYVDRRFYRPKPSNIPRLPDRFSIK
jgi:hypothetical protein